MCNNPVRQANLRSWFGVAVLTLLLVVNASAHARLFGKKDDVSDVRTVTRVLPVQGRERSYILHVPLSARDGVPMPLVLVFHGGYDTPENAISNTGFNRLADREGFLVAYPAGVDKHWNDGRGVANAEVDDVAFVRAMIEDIRKVSDVDPRRIYATGASNGGMFTQRLACELADIIAAFAPVISSLPEAIRQQCRPVRAVSILMINGSDDKMVPWNGGEMKGKGGRILPVPASVEFWARHADCPATSPAASQLLPDRDPRDRTRVRQTQYSGCRDGAEVILFEIEGGGHTWPGGENRQMPMVLGITSRDIEATTEIWRFFRRHPGE